VRTAGQSLPVSLLRAARPKQWMKNVLVAAAPGAAGVLGQRRVLEHTALAFVAFCLVASGTYLLNDVRDIESDRRHPTKQRRPIAAGDVPEGLAIVVGIIVIAAGLAVGVAVNWKFSVVLGVYMAITVAYTVRLKHVTVVDIAAVASGYVIRAVAGGVAVPVPISEWFLIVAAAGSLFMVAGKRHGEHLDLGDRECELLRTAGSLHDLGKIGVRDDILNKPGPLTDEEWEIMRRHPDIGADMLAQHSALAQVAPLVRHHHERWDGSGYPAGLKGDVIPFGARILSVADSFDTITGTRLYRRSLMTPIEGVEDISRRAGHWRERDDCRTHWQCASLRQCASSGQTP